VDHVSLGQLLLLLPVAAAGGLVQGSIGFGFALVVVPVLALIEPAALPATIILMTFPMVVLLALRERSHIDVPGFVSIASGRVLGSIAGAWVLVILDPDALTALIGVLVVLAVVLTAGWLEVSPTRPLTFGAGIVSGAMGTAAGIGGPAIAVVYQRRPGPVLRSTINLSFVFGQVVTVAALLVADKIERWHLVFSAELLPGVLLGMWASARVARFLDRAWLRPVVLVFAGGAGLLIAVRGLAGA
jgi:hypothetical protein